jgi:hypothetical protein
MRLRSWRGNLKCTEYRRHWKQALGHKLLMRTLSMYLYVAIMLLGLAGASVSRALPLYTKLIRLFAKDIVASSTRKRVQDVQASNGATPHSAQLVSSELQVKRRYRIKRKLPLAIRASSSDLSKLKGACVVHVASCRVQHTRLMDADRFWTDQGVGPQKMARSGRPSAIATGCPVWRPTERLTRRTTIAARCCAGSLMIPCRIRNRRCSSRIVFPE